MAVQTAPSLEPELAAFERLRGELLATAPGQYALLHKEDLVGTFPTAMAAVNAGYARFGHVPLLVKQIVAVDTPLLFATPLAATLPHGA
jgi:hypothetical protein